MTVKIAHISDLHFGKISLNPLQFLSKRWIGNANLILNRKKHFQPEKLLKDLSTTFLDHQINGVVITGDFTTTSLNKEYKMAKALTDELERQGIWVIALPGNHDHYTKKAYREKRFYDFFFSSSHLTPYGDFSLKMQGMEVFKFDFFWIVSLDTTLATPLFSASGVFPEEMEKALTEFLLQREPSEIVLLCNHFPFFQQGNPRNFLKRGEVLEAILKRFSCVKLYLHGHNHRNCIADLRAAKLPILLDSGSVSKVNHASWNEIALEPHGCRISAYFKASKADQWEAKKTLNFSW